LAVGAKHFEPTNQKLKSVAGTGPSSFWPKGYWHPNFWPKGYWRDSLVVELWGVAREQFGPQMDVLQLAEEVMKFWKNNEDLRRKVI